MATTLQNIMSAIRGESFVPAAQVNYGYTDNLIPPYITLTEYSHTLEYDTSGPVLKDAVFTVTVFDKSQDEAEAIAEQVDDFVNNNLELTPQAIGCFQTAYTVGQMAERLYQFGVEIKYELKEDIREE